MKIKLSFIFFFILITFILSVFFKSLFEDKSYIPEKLNYKIENISIKEFYSDNNLELKDLFDNEEYIVINIWASWCLPCRQEHQHITNLSKINNLKLYKLLPKNISSFHQFVIRVDIKKRDKLRNYLKAKNIQTMIHYPYMLNELKFFPKTKDLKKSQRLGKKILSLPISEEHSEKEIYFVTEKIIEFFK